MHDCRLSGPGSILQRPALRGLLQGPDPGPTNGHGRVRNCAGTCSFGGRIFRVRPAPQRPPGIIGSVVVVICLAAAVVCCILGTEAVSRAVCWADHAKRSVGVSPVLCGFPPKHVSPRRKLPHSLSPASRVW